MKKTNYWPFIIIFASLVLCPYQLIISSFTGDVPKSPWLFSLSIAGIKSIFFLFLLKCAYKQIRGTAIKEFGGRLTHKQLREGACFEVVAYKIMSHGGRFLLFEINPEVMLNNGSPQFIEGFPRSWFFDKDEVWIPESGLANKCLVRITRVEKNGAGDRWWKIKIVETQIPTNAPVKGKLVEVQ